MSYFYDRFGMPVSLERWAQLMDEDNGKFVAKDLVGHYLVSTIWLGLDHQIFGGPPMIFETCVFYIPHEGAEWETILEPVRYPSEEAALAGHKKILQEVKSGEHPYSISERMEN